MTRLQRKIVNDINFYLDNRDVYLSYDVIIKVCELDDKLIRSTNSWQEYMNICENYINDKDTLLRINYFLDEF